MRGTFSRKLLTWTRSLQGRMRFWPPPIGKIPMGGGVRTPNLQRTWPIAWRKRRLSWREGSSNLSLRCHMLSNKWAGFSCTERNFKRPGRRQRRRSNAISTTHALWAHVLIYSGEPEEALRKSQEAIDYNPIYPFFYDYHRGQAYYVWGVLTSAQDPNASRQRFEEAETHLREALRKNNNFRPARSYLVAVLSELGRQDEAVKEMNISLEKGEPLAKILKSGNQQLADEHIRTLTPYTNQEIRSRLANAWREAAR